MRRKYPAFDESEHGFSTFSKFLEEAATAGIVRIETDPRSGTYRVELAGGAAPPLPEAAVAAPAAERVGDEGDGPAAAAARWTAARPRHDRGRWRPTRRTARPRCSRSVVTPTPDIDLGTLPPLDEPISYEDMIMLGPEVGEDVPELAEVSDVGTDGEPPSRSSRRRRRRAASDPEPTVADLEPLDAAELAEPVVLEEVVVLEEPVVSEEPVVAEPVAEDDEATPRRRRRRRLTAAEDEAPGEAPIEEAVAVPEPPPAPEEAPAVTGRRRVRRRATPTAEAMAPAAEAVVEAAPPAEAEAEDGPQAEAAHPQGRPQGRGRGRGRDRGRRRPQAQAAHPQGRPPRPRPRPRP